MQYFLLAGWMKRINRRQDWRVCIFIDRKRILWNGIGKTSIKQIDFIDSTA